MARIKFNQNILLNDWSCITNGPDIITWTRAELYQWSIDIDFNNLNTSKGQGLIIIYADRETNIADRVRFYYQLNFLDDLFNPGNKKFNIPAQDMMKKVDKFLIRMSKLQGLL
jgi:hypothetical protein